MSNEVLRIEGVKKQYPGVLALKGVDLSFKGGEIHGLIGENGAGKSTLIKILAGIVKSDEGSFFFDGVPSAINSSKDTTKLGLSFIHQELNLIGYQNAMENIFLGHPYPTRLGAFIDWKELRVQTQKILDTLKITIPLTTPVQYLSAVDRAMVAIARAFAVSARVYFMDEPATSLTDLEKANLFTVVRNLKAQGKTVVYVTHNLDDILDITDRVTIMRDGQVVHSSDTEGLTKDDLIRKMIGQSLQSAFPQRKGEITSPVLEVKGLTNSHLHDISFSLRAGEILGIGGLVGSGRTELLETLFGVRPIEEGEMILNGESYLPSSPKDAIDHGVVLVPEERRRGGLLLQRSIYENISLMSLKDISHWGFLDHRLIASKTEAAGKAVKLKASNYHFHAGTLSGGNQQKVVFAKTVLRSPTVLMLDEPSKGVDVGARFEIYSIIRDLAAKGVAVILVSSDFNEVLGLADRIVFIKEGHMVMEIENIQMNPEQYLFHCYGKQSV